MKLLLFSFTENPPLLYIQLLHYILFNHFRFNLSEGNILACRLNTSIQGILIKKDFHH